MNDAAPRKLVISKANEADRLVRIGLLEFDDANQATLSTEDSGQDASQLMQDWYAIAEQDELMWKTTVPGEVDGEVVMKRVAEMVRPDDENYIYAVYDTLSRSYGYSVDFGK